jgi:hypothetical protein
MSKLVRKNVFLDPVALKRAQRALAEPNESATIRKALDLVAFREEALRRFDRVAGKAPRFGEPWEEP